MIHGFMVAQDTDTAVADAKVWEIKAIVQRGTGSATTTILGTPTITEIYADAGASGWTVTVTADTGNGGVAVSVAGAPATTIRWVCSIDTTEVSNG
jgi:hypothetical protein